MSDSVTSGQSTGLSQSMTDVTMASQTVALPDYEDDDVIPMTPCKNTSTPPIATSTPKKIIHPFSTAEG